MILIINICKERLHEFEFVKPVCDILLKNKINYYVKNYLKLNADDLRHADKIIICGTSLKDSDFINKVFLFKWIKNFNKPLLGICGGMHLLGLVFNGKIKEKTEIGYFFEDFKKLFLGLFGRKEVYHLHQKYVEFDSNKFEICSGNKIPQAVKHKNKELYGVLFHPEVRQKDLIKNFCLM